MKPHLGLMAAHERAQLALNGHNEWCGYCHNNPRLCPVGKVLRMRWWQARRALRAPGRLLP